MATLGERAGAFWLAWKWVLMLGAALAASLGVNYWQHRRALTAPLRAENKDLRDTVAVYEALMKQRTTDDADLMADLRAIADRARPLRVEYIQAKTERPLAPNCAPGQARMDAVNAGADP